MEYSGSIVSVRRTFAALAPGNRGVRVFEGGGYITMASSPCGCAAISSRCFSYTAGPFTRRYQYHNPGSCN